MQSGNTCKHLYDQFFGTHHMHAGSSWIAYNPASEKPTHLLRTLERSQSHRLPSSGNLIFMQMRLWLAAQQHPTAAHLSMTAYVVSRLSAILALA